MSIYSECSQAISDLAELRDTFTEIDVVNLAAADGWGKPEFKKARMYASQILSAKYTRGDVVRYGYVAIDGTEQKDYARKASVIIYGDVENGPPVWETPNGRFAQVVHHMDSIQSTGRRKGRARSDERLWSEQGFDNLKVAKPSAPRRPTPRPAPAVVSTGDSAEVTALRQRVTQLEAENERLRAELATERPITRREVEDLVLEMVGPLEERLAKAIA